MLSLAYGILRRKFIMSDFDDSKSEKEILDKILDDDEVDEESLQADESEDAPEAADDAEAEAAESEEPAAEEPAAEVDETFAEEPSEESAEDDEPLSAPITLSPEDDSVSREARSAIDDAMDDGPVTLITEGTTINGSISSEGPLEIRGTVNGNVSSKDVLYIQGMVHGDVSAEKLYVNTPRLEGNLSSTSDIKISKDTVVIGDVRAAVDDSLCYIAGAVKGNIDVNGSVEIGSSAIVKGDISSKSVQVNNGAVVDGHFALTYAEIGNIDDFFDDKSSK
jgi:cytoskeletal protein CcmA (bactofilin family)